jgi:hypothetical protein
LREIEDDGKSNNSNNNGKIVATSYLKANKNLLENSVMDFELSLLNSNQMIGSLKSIYELYWHF